MNVATQVFRVLVINIYICCEDMFRTVVVVVVVGSSPLRG